MSEVETERRTQRELRTFVGQPGTMAVKGGRSSMMAQTCVR